VLPEYLTKHSACPSTSRTQDTYSIVKKQIPEGKTMCSLCSRLRRGILYRVADELGATKIALGHHRDDMLQTFFLNMFFGGKLKGMPPKLVSDDGRHIVIRPLAYVAEKDLARWAEHRSSPSSPAPVRQPGEPAAQADGAMLREWEKQLYPGRIENMFNALQNVVPSHLMDEAELPEDAQRWRKRDPHWAPEGGESLTACASASTAPLHTPGSAPHGRADRAGGARRRAGRAVPRRHRPGAAGAAHLAAGNAAINRLLWTPEGLSLVGWADTQHLDNAVAMKTTPDLPPAPGAQRRPARGPHRHARPGGGPGRHGAQHRAHGRLCPQAPGALAPARQDAQERRARRLQLQRAGAVGVCVQKTAEAEALAAAACATSPSPTRSSPPKLLRVAGWRTPAGGAAAWRWPWTAPRASSAWPRPWPRLAPQARIDVLVEIDVGQGRCGVPPGEPPWRWPRPWRATQLRFAGLQAYHGRAQHLRSAAERREPLRPRRAGGAPHARPHRGRRAAGAAGHGLGHRHLVHEAASGVYGELQAGVPVHGRRLRPQRARPRAARVRARAVRQDAGHQACATHAVCDAGHKSHAIDSGLPTVALLPGRACATPTAATSMACCMPTAPRPGCPRWATCCGWCRGTATPR
jgi:D-serine deaminase-like pyridoxal phosphate-dependent protein